MDLDGRMKSRTFCKVEGRKQSFENLGAKNKLLWKLRNENDILPKRKKSKDKRFLAKWSENT